MSPRPRAPLERGSALAAVMVTVAILGILMTAAAQQWSFVTRREMEKELAYRGANIVNAIDEYRRLNNRLPTKLEEMTEGQKPTLRRVWVDPMTARYDRNGELVEGTGEWQILTPQAQAAGGLPTVPGRGRQRTRATGSTVNIQGILGVASKSEELSIGGWGDLPAGTPYSEWRFEVPDYSTGMAPSSGGFRSGIRHFDPGELRPAGFGGTDRPPGAPAPAQLSNAQQQQQPNRPSR